MEDAPSRPDVQQKLTNKMQEMSEKYKSKSRNWKIGVIVVICIVLFLIIGVPLIVKSKDGFQSPGYNQNLETKFEPYTNQIPPLKLDKEPFNNDLPVSNVNLETESTYNDAIKDMALEQTVKDQHNQYVQEKNKITSTASFLPVKTGSDDLIPWVGLRRPQYLVNGKDMVDADARQVPTVIDGNQLSKPTNLRWD